MRARSFTFASLLLAAANPVFAEEPQTSSATYVDVGLPDKLSVAAKWELKIKGNTLVAELKLVNTGTAAVDIVAARGHTPGPGVNASIDDIVLTRVLEPAQERDMMSRMGPMPVFGAIAAGGERNIGTYTFELPEGYAGKTLLLVTWVHGQGTEARLPVTLLLDSRGAV